MADFPGQDLTAPALLLGPQGGSGILFPTSLILGHQGASGRLFDGIGVGSVITVHYKLTALCTTDGLRHYWTDTAVSLALAPPCVGGYVAGSLAVLGSWQVFS